MTGIILAGGKNTRIGTNKAFLKLGSKTIIENIIDKFKNIFDEILIVTNTPSAFNYLADRHFIRVVKDIIRGKGSLGGLYSGLVNSKSEYSFVVACDMPFLNVELIKYIKNNRADFDVIIPKIDKGYETLHAIYSKNCIGVIEKLLKKDKLKIVDILSYIRAKEITENVIKKFDPQLLSFFNINTNADYQKALQWKN